MHFSLRGWFTALCLVGALTTQAQVAPPKQITLDDIWGQNAGTFTPRTVQGVNWMKAGGFYTTLANDRIVKYSITDGKAVDTLFDARTTRAGGQVLSLDDYQLSADEQKLLLTTAEEPIYRRSSRATFYVYDLSTRQLRLLSQGDKQQYATFSPDGRKVAFVRDNNLFTVELAMMAEKQLTTDGKRNEIINGGADWVYEEEFSMARAFEWSPDSRRLAFIRFDEREVPEYNMQVWGELYPADYKFKYPKAGDNNSQVSVWVADAATGQKLRMETGSPAETDVYLPRIQWTRNPNLLSIRRLNRLQTQLDLLHADATTGKSVVILTETPVNTLGGQPSYVDLEFTDDLTYLADGQTFIWTSERSGFKHVYRYDMTGRLLGPVTAGNYEVLALLGVDEKKQVAYYLSAEVSPLEKHLYKIGLDGKNKQRLTMSRGSHSANFSPDFAYYLLSHTTANTPLTVSLFRAGAPDAKPLRVLETNENLRRRLNLYPLSAKRFFTVPIPTGERLNAWMIRPTNFDSTKRHPVLMFVYGGPGSQTVKNEWDSRDYFWYQMLAQKGYIIVSVDNRGTGARGNAFRTVTYGQLGKIETQDQISAAKYLKALPYVDPARVGIWGWSYGGYMTSLCMTLGADVFKTGIAVAPVTNWRFYDTIYTERYLKRPQDNPQGYDENSPVTHADKLKGNFLLIHGTGDDNVHFQNSVEFVNALVAAGKPFRSFYYPNRNHGIYGGNTRQHLYQMLTDFILEKL
ncbi:prolyl oligopeptidase family serine peptidase [Rudanella paleaurantiibacter]|uniref:Prolyl oligopeptidase family serine peptidase n=1 Tax=Rudanella paleaurantiibacter TaxID=2614655 RepID=A0A7J5U3S2_9BACT|nr:S9 family peptidase [Rudanella paleaurantiibacter]KAB7731685.1 prolyl oligopeptidase family serine peptidase [Rudanella paleaurantiibacter]